MNDYVAIQTSGGAQLNNGTFTLINGYVSNNKVVVLYFHGSAFVYCTNDGGDTLIFYSVEGTILHGLNINDDDTCQGFYSEVATVSSPAFTGTPTAPTAVSGTSTTQIATTEFVDNEIYAAMTGSGFYTKPSGGIPATDLASAVQTSLGKADTAIQSVKVNGTALTPDANKAVDVVTSGVIETQVFQAYTLDDLTNQDFEISGLYNLISAHLGAGRIPIIRVPIDSGNRVSDFVYQSTTDSPGYAFTCTTPDGLVPAIYFLEIMANDSADYIKVSAVAPGTLKTNNTTAQTASASEPLSGTINLHRVAKTGTYSDLIGTPTIPTESTVSG